MDRHFLPDLVQQQIKVDKEALQHHNTLLQLSRTPDMESNSSAQFDSSTNDLFFRHYAGDSAYSTSNQPLLLQPLKTFSRLSGDFSDHSGSSFTTFRNSNPSPTSTDFPSIDFGFGSSTSSINNSNYSRTNNNNNNTSVTNLRPPALLTPINTQFTNTTQQQQSSSLSPFLDELRVQSPYSYDHPSNIHNPSPLHYTNYLPNNNNNRHVPSPPLTPNQIFGVSQDRPHSCNQCSRAFKRSSDLKRHERTVHTKHRLSCCNITFTRFDTLKRHKRKNHSDLLASGEMEL